MLTPAAPLQSFLCGSPDGLKLWSSRSNSGDGRCLSKPSPVDEDLGQRGCMQDPREAYEPYGVTVCISEGSSGEEHSSVLELQFLISLEYLNKPK